MKYRVIIKEVVSEQFVLEPGEVQAKRMSVYDENYNRMIEWSEF